MGVNTPLRITGLKECELARVCSGFRFLSRICAMLILPLGGLRSARTFLPKPALQSLRFGN